MCHFGPATTPAGQLTLIGYAARLARIRQAHSWRDLGLSCARRRARVWLHAGLRANPNNGRQLEGFLAARRRASASFIAHTETSTGCELPGVIKDEFDAFLECGILAHGFLRLRCGGCGHDKLLALSRKRRGLYPSGRRWAQRAECSRCAQSKRLGAVPVRCWSAISRRSSASAIGTSNEPASSGTRRPSERASQVGIAHSPSLSEGGFWDLDGSDRLTSDAQQVRCIHTLGYTSWIYK